MCLVLWHYTWSVVCVRMPIHLLPFLISPLNLYVIPGRQVYCTMYQLNFICTHRGQLPLSISKISQLHPMCATRNYIFHMSMHFALHHEEMTWCTCLYISYRMYKICENLHFYTNTNSCRYVDNNLKMIYFKLCQYHLSF